MIDLMRAMSWKYKGKECRYQVGETYETLLWDETSPLPKPTREECEQFDIEYQAFWQTIKYKAERQRSFPITDEMIIALWEAVCENRPESMNALQAKRLEVKSKYPKPL